MSQLAYIPPYYLCEDGKTKVHFKAPTVADYRSFCGMSTDMEENVTTEYLNRMQDKENHPAAWSDSAKWTSHDRRAGLYWIYVHTRSDTVITQNYTCSHCNQEHGRQFDILELMEGIEAASEKMTKAVALPGKGNGLIVPLRGSAMEHIEIIRNQRNSYPKDSEDWAKLNMDMRVFEIAHCIRFVQEDGSLSDVELAQLRFDYLMSLDAEREFRPLAAAVKLTLIDMQHGLESTYHEGEIALVTPLHYCPVIEEQREDRIEQLKAGGVVPDEWPADLKEGNTAATRLLLPFQSHHFFPEI